MVISRLGQIEDGYPSVARPGYDLGVHDHFVLRQST